MTWRLADSIRVLRGMGEKTARVFESRLVFTLEDLSYFLPRGWLDATTVVPLARLRPDVIGVVRVKVLTVQLGRSQRSGTPYLRATIGDETDTIGAMWFHPRFLANRIYVGATLLLYGRCRRLGAGERVMMAPSLLAKPAILPVYPAIGGVTTGRIRALMGQLQPLIAEMSDFLPPNILVDHQLCSLTQALNNLHFPENLAAVETARRRWGFDEILLLLAPSLINRRTWDKTTIDRLPPNPATLASWRASLPFILTDDQERTIEAINHDLARPQPMNRLIQGDVGSGKTVVALAAAIQTMTAGKAVVWLAPTELLARQHFLTASKLLGKTILDRPIGLWTRTQRVINDHGIKKASSGQLAAMALIIGTHALLADSLDLPPLGLLIIDEQHRFGVNQRGRLRQRGAVHLLSMTATPIPRTLALALYGNLDISVIRTKPLGRKPIITRVVAEKNRSRAYAFIDTHVSRGRQVYVICPAVEPVELDEGIVFGSLFQTIEETKAVTTWHKTIQSVFPRRRVAMLHGKMASNEKKTTMDAFRRREIDILVSTTVVEVGVDVPGATIMVVENAERFGLAQLHQLRGRVGRSDCQSYCLLFPTVDSQRDHARLKLLEATDDGFALAQQDLDTRGPGELAGESQSGLPRLRFADLRDVRQVEIAQKVAGELIDLPEFRQACERFWRSSHPE